MGIEKEETEEQIEKMEGMKQYHNRVQSKEKMKGGNSGWWAAQRLVSRAGSQKMEEKSGKYDVLAPEEFTKVR